MKLHIPSTPSTNTLLTQILADGSLDQFLKENNQTRDLFTLYTYNQTAGRGQAGNHWESEPNKNLTFSTLFDITDIHVENQFVLSQIVPLAIKNVLQPLLKDTTKKIRIKWPNDIYYGDKKLGGILIEHSIIDGKISYSIAGIGLNINQTIFLSDAPNPVSLKQITGREYDLDVTLDQIIAEFKRLKPLIYQPAELKSLYMNDLYRIDNYYKFKSDNKIFEAQITDVASNGLITMTTKDNTKLTFAFKEVSYII